MVLFLFNIMLLYRHNKTMSVLQMVMHAIAAGDSQVAADALRIGQYTEGLGPANAKELAGRLFVTVYMGSINSSNETRTR